MAIITNIRKYSSVALFFIGFSIVAFVLADLLGGGVSGPPKRYVGEINGQGVEQMQYNEQVEQAVANYRNQTGKSPSDAEMNGIRDQVWNSFLFDYAYRDQFDILGIQVSKEELYQMVQGDSIFIAPQIRQQFTNPQTGQFDINQVVEFLKNLSQYPPQQRAQWASFEEFLVNNRLQTKYEGLFTASNYVTKAEAERDYQNKNTKANVKYLYVPFTSIADSTLNDQITDALLKEELNKYPEKYKAQETRSLDYVVFDISPSPEDSLVFGDEIKQLAKDFAASANDSSFSALQSDNPSPFVYQRLAQVPPVLLDNNPTILKGGVYGPYIEGKSYQIFKVSDVKSDSVESTRARHILFKVDKEASAEEKAKVRTQANEVLQKIKDGEDFAALAAQYGQDGTSQRGGDLGWFPEGQMVGPFNDAVFAYSEPGLIPNLVETEFGLHIVEVTAPKTDQLYKIARVDRILEPSEVTRDSVLLRAEELRSESNSAEEFAENVDKNPKLVMLNANKLSTTSTSLGVTQGARSVIRWAFNDAELGDVSEVFEIQDENKYIIATLKDKTEKDESNIEIFREQLSAEVAKDLKADIILKKLAESKGKSLEELAKAYGTEANVGSANDLTLSSNVLGSTGFNPQAVGKAFGLKKGAQSEPFRDDNGVLILKIEEVNNAAKIADYAQYKNDLKNANDQRIRFLISEAIKDASYIEDERYKYY